MSDGNTKEALFSVSRWLFQTAFFANLSRRIFCTSGLKSQQRQRHAPCPWRYPSSLHHGQLQTPGHKDPSMTHPWQISPSPGGADPWKSIPHRGGQFFFGANDLMIHPFFTEVILLTSENLPWKFAPKSQCFAHICRKTAQYLWHKISPLSSNLSKQNWVIRAQLTTQIPDFITKLTNSYVASISMYI